MFIGRAISAYLGNVVAFLAAAFLITGFDLIGSVSGFLLLMLVVTVIHLLIRPIIKLVFSPVIILTLGLFNIVINAIILYIVDIYSQNISIDGLMPLFYGTLLISVVGVLLHNKPSEK
ncbi:MAG: phage holin family protein [bacterium]|nr:phage holin family protein [bacterium]